MRGRPIEEVGAGFREERDRKSDFDPRFRQRFGRVRNKIGL